MLPLKEAIAEKHSLAEKMPFNQRMFKGELSKEEYIAYLCQQLGIFDAIEDGYELPHTSLNRVDNILADIHELMGIDDTQQLQIELLDSTLKYREYLNSLTQEQILPHIYLNYLAIMFGGQMMKAKTPGSGKMYKFDGDIREIVGSIRAIQKDEWADEANKSLDYNISILDELQRVSESAGE